MRDSAWTPAGWQASAAFAAGLFERLRAATSEAGGICRPSYAPGEQRAHDLVAAAARELGMEVSVDCAGNLHMTLPGRDRSAPRWLTGSHLDAVPDGGNFDGAAGVVAGLTVAHALRRSGAPLPADLTVIGFRAEEGSSWFAGPHKSHFGSRALLGQLPRQEMEAATSLADGATLFECMRRAGCQPERIEAGRSHIDLARVRGFVELHIEQGPVLVERGMPVGIVTGIRGTLRVRNGHSRGAYAHSGAVPREWRRDALFAAADLAMQLERRWDEWLAAGRDAVCTMGRFSTDPQRHSLTKVPGSVRFTIDIRSQEEALLLEARCFLQEAARAAGQRRGVELDLGSMDIAAPALMDAAWQALLREQAASLDIPALELASGAGHDAANFAGAGVPTAMIFVRNDHGSHNPREAMDMADFSLAARLMGGFLAHAP